MQAVEAPLADKRRPRAARVVTRPITAARPGDLGPLEDAQSLPSGRVLLLSLEPVAEHLAADWQGRRVEVYGRVAKILAKRLAGAGDFLRTSETDYLVVQPTAPSETAENSAAEIWIEAVREYLPSDVEVAPRLYRVVRLHDQQVVCEPLNGAAILARANARHKRDADDGAWDVIATETWTPFVTSDGRQVRPSCSLEPVFEIASHNRIGYRLRRRLIDVATGEELTATQQSHLSRADTLRIDTATLARGIERLNSGADHEAALSLILPVSYVSLTHPDSADRFGLMFASARTSVQAGVICEIYDIEGISEAALAAAVAVVRPWSLLVVGRLAGPQPRASTAMKAAGLQALSFAIPDNIESDAEFIGWLRAAIGSARRVGRSVMALGCQNQRRLALAGLLGATHASLSA